MDNSTIRSPNELVAKKRTSGYVQVIQSPSHEELADFVSNAHAASDLVTIYATCSVEFTGNREGTIGEGDRVIICKEDGSVVVHRPTSARAVASQGVRSSLETVVLDDCVRIYSARNQQETIRVDITDASGAVRQGLTDNATLQENQTEQQMHRAIQSNPDSIEEGLRIIEHERKIPHGRIDFFAKDIDGNPVVIEIKQPTARYPHVDQLQRYVSYFRESTESHVRGILIAPSIHVTVERLLREQNLEWVEFEEYQQRSTPPGQTSVDEWHD